MSAPATVAQPLKKSWKLTGTTGQRYLAAPAIPSARGPQSAPQGKRSAWSGAVLAGWAEGVGFEPTMRLAPHSGFQDRRHRPLGEPSWRSPQPLISRHRAAPEISAPPEQGVSRKHGRHR